MAIGINHTNILFLDNLKDLTVGILGELDGNFGSILKNDVPRYHFDADIFDGYKQLGHIHALIALGYFNQIPILSLLIDCYCRCRIEGKVDNIKKFVNLVSYNLIHSNEKQYFEQGLIDAIETYRGNPTNSKNAMKYDDKYMDYLEYYNTLNNVIHGLIKTNENIQFFSLDVCLVARSIYYTDKNMAFQQIYSDIINESINKLDGSIMNRLKNDSTDFEVYKQKPGQSRKDFLLEAIKKFQYKFESGKRYVIIIDRRNERKFNDRNKFKTNYGQYYKQNNIRDIIYMVKPTEYHYIDNRTANLFPELSFWKYSSSILPPYKPNKIEVTQPIGNFGFVWSFYVYNKDRVAQYWYVFFIYTTHYGTIFHISGSKLINIRFCIMFLSINIRTLRFIFPFNIGMHMEYHKE